MSLEIDAVYDNGTLKLPRLLPIKEGETVRITIECKPGQVIRGWGVIGWKGDPAVLERVATDPDFGLEECP
jgi:predicted DNA-binding antitoxin AbrB/MazE fold protein